MKPTKAQKELFKEINREFAKLHPPEIKMDFPDLEIKIPDEAELKKELNERFGLMSRFKQFDTVRHYLYGLGTVICFEEILIGVCFDEYNPHFHSLGGRCEAGFGLFCHPSSLEKVE
ncbi:hypothetical protein [Holdemania sp. 1001095H_141210_F2]|uniref:hypothetical protein n=1 Tax=Holdemania sp. 1001095H_141210_F2 TaxID=2787149 RepID=UPI00189F52A2|nr:hypothetical protein [Holdemania sp. 1001095H_141210_F2]